jgi:cytochrome c551/c552
MPARLQFGGDKLDVSLEFAHNSTSSHPVMRDATDLARPSVLKFMWNLGFTAQGRAMTTRVLCTDCHNSDTNREFGGAGPNGPHGSKFDHILERSYVTSKVALGGQPGTAIVNVTSPVILDPIPNAPYSLCAKCHDLNYIASGASWAEHTRHIQDGFSCSVCHSAHGVPAGTAGVPGTRLVNFDLNVVAPNGGVIAYNGASCTLKCHNHTH